MKWPPFKYKPFVNPFDTNLPNWYELALFCVFDEQSSFAFTRGTDFCQFTATDARFRKFSRIKKQIWEENLTTFVSSLYRISDWNMRVVIILVNVPVLTRSWKNVAPKKCKFTIQNLWLKYEGSHYLVNVPVLTRSWKKVAPKKCKWQLKCVQLWKTLCNNF